MTENSDKPVALKPCPFCRSVAKHIERSNPMSKWRHSVDCCSTTCGMSGPVEATKAEAIAAWNRRPTSAGNSDETILSEIAEMMSAHVENWPSPKRLRTAIKLIDKTLAAALVLPAVQRDSNTDELLNAWLFRVSLECMGGTLCAAKSIAVGGSVLGLTGLLAVLEQAANDRAALSALDLPTIQRDARREALELLSIISGLEAALKQIAGGHWERFGTEADVDEVPDLSADEAMRLARDALVQAFALKEGTSE